MLLANILVLNDYKHTGTSPNSPCRYNIFWNYRMRETITLTLIDCNFLYYVLAWYKWYILTVGCVFIRPPHVLLVLYWYQYNVVDDDTNTMSLLLFDLANIKFLNTLGLFFIIIKLYYCYYSIFILFWWEDDVCGASSLLLVLCTSCSAVRCSVTSLAHNNNHPDQYNNNNK